MAETTVPLRSAEWVAKRRGDLLTVAEAAAHIGRSVSWLRRHPPHCGGPRRWQPGGPGCKVLYRIADLDKFIDMEPEECETTSSAGPKLAQMEAPTNRPSGMSSSDAKVSESGEALARQIAEKLRRKHAQSVSNTSGRPVFKVVKG